jgi:hypothetical protein
MVDGRLLISHNLILLQGWGFCHKACESDKAGFVNELKKVVFPQGALIRVARWF